MNEELSAVSCQLSAKTLEEEIRYLLFELIADS